MGVSRQEGEREEEEVRENTLVGREEREEIIGQVQLSLVCFQIPAGTELLNVGGTYLLKQATKRAHFKAT